MGNLPGAAFRIITNAIVLALLATMLGGCVATPSRYQDRKGDFISHIAGTADTFAPTV